LLSDIHIVTTAVSRPTPCHSGIKTWEAQRSCTGSRKTIATNRKWVIWRTGVI